MGNQWEVLSSIWKTYFSIPSRTVKIADRFGDFSNTLGLHYRGTDKNRDSRQTNPISNNEFLTLVKDFVNNHDEIKSIFIASDENSVKELIRDNFKEIKVIDIGKVGFWDTLEKSNNYQKGDQAVLDCLLLSKCKYLLKNQSALSGFAKILNPRLKAYRIAASKLFTDIPYFPDVYITPFKSDNPECKKILSKLFKDDWLENVNARQKYSKPFTVLDRGTRYFRNNTFYNNSIIYWMRKNIHSQLRKIRYRY